MTNENYINEKITVTIAPQLLEKLNKVVEIGPYRNRSDYINEAIRAHMNR